MIAASVLTARWTKRRLAADARRGRRSGSASWLSLYCSRRRAALGVALRGASPAEVLVNRDPWPGPRTTSPSSCSRSCRGSLVPVATSGDEGKTSTTPRNRNPKAPTPNAGQVAHEHLPKGCLGDQKRQEARNDPGGDHSPDLGAGARYYLSVGRIDGDSVSER